MASDGLSPSYVKLYYEAAPGPHTATIPVNLVAAGLPGGTFELFTKGGSQVAWETGIAAYVTALKPNAPATTTFQYAELYTQETPDDEPLFLSSHVLGVAGTHASAVAPASQIVWSLRSDLGGKGFVYLMDSPNSSNLKYKAPSYGNAAFLGMVTYLIGSTSIFVCRDNGSPVTCTKVVTKTNDALRRRYRLN